MLATAASRWDPKANADGSLNVAASMAAAPEAGTAGAGDGVAGMFAEEEPCSGAGAAGGAGVEDEA